MPRQRYAWPNPSLLCVLLACSVIAFAPLAAAAPQEAVPAESPAGVWIGPDGEPLPFQNQSSPYGRHSARSAAVAANLYS